MNQPLSQAEMRNWQRSMSTRIANLAREQDRGKDSIQFQLVFECFLSRIFSKPSSEWILKGGTALLMRNGSGRFTRDIDLAHGHKWEDTSQIAQQLESLMQRKGADPFTFKITNVHSRQAGTFDGYSDPTATVTVKAFLGARSFHSFRIDVTLGRHTQTPPELVRVTPLLNLVTKEGGYEPFSILVTPVEAHLADKICAMRESHLNGVSTRFHDLADIIQIIRTQDFTAEKLLSILSHEVKRRRIDWPEKITSPGSNWEKDYAQKSPTYAELPKELHSLQGSLNYAGSCLNEVLQRKRIHGTWSHRTSRWSS